MIARYTLAVTSCARHDLLKRTLESFVNTADEAPVETIVIEDSDAPIPEWWNELKPRLGWRATWLSNGCRCGQIYAADRLMESIKTEYLFWCEDDWAFTQSGYIQGSFDILGKYPKIITVSVRGNDWNHPLIKDDGFPGTFIAQPYWGGGWGGFMFNPGLRRLSDYKRIGSFGRHVSYNASGLAHELALSKKLLDAGYRIAALPGDHCHHIGGGRSRACETLPDKPKILLAVPTCQALKYGQWESEQSPHYDRRNKPYGIDIHVSGSNPRVDAVRATWWRDIEPFRSHVTGKFFYGATFVGEPQADEVVLDCPDDYGSLPLKTKATCRWAYDNGFDYLLKLDDDAFVWVDRAVSECLGGRWDYAGNIHCNLALGGAGYWLSRRAMKIIAEAGQPDHWAEDMWVGLTLRKAGIVGVQLPHFTGCSNHYFDLENIPDNASVIHSVKPEDMAKPYQYLGPIAPIK